MSNRTSERRAVGQTSVASEGPNSALWPLIDNSPGARKRGGSRFGRGRRRISQTGSKLRVLALGSSAVSTTTARYMQRSGCPRSPVRGVAHAARRRACLPPANTPEVPFCAAGKVATAVVLARRSAPERIRPAAPTTPAAERGSECFAVGHGASVLSPVAAPGTTGIPLGTRRNH
jgi:hypothetical protein